MNIKAVFFDLDGTLYFKEKAIEGAIRTVDYLKSKGYICRFLTNTDSKKTSQILALQKGKYIIILSRIFMQITLVLLQKSSKKLVVASNLDESIYKIDLKGKKVS